MWHTIGGWHAEHIDDMAAYVFGGAVLLRGQVELVPFDVEERDRFS
jgi:hypothetical protein